MRHSIARTIKSAMSGTALMALSIVGCSDTSNPLASQSPAAPFAKYANQYSYQSKSNPTRTEVYDGAKLIATFTNGSHTVTLAGPSRTFTETNTVQGTTYTATITHTTWVRTLPATFNGTVDTTWLNDAIAANTNGTSDVLAIAMEYVDGAAAAYQGSQKIAGDADYGPLMDDGTRQEGSDFNDYLGLDWAYGSTSDPAESGQINSLDCSGFMRMVWGYRHHGTGVANVADTIPMSLDPTASFTTLPRKSFQICDSAVGTMIIANSGGMVTNYAPLNIGDLVFFDADTSATDGSRIDHVGMYMGVDNAGKRRFISSRKSINGPTMGDYKGSSLLDKFVKKSGTNIYEPVLYTKAFRAARRL
ncbi:MAG: hypothetical protein DYG96_10060 [Chlorobi bacterium CHB2]|nr:hypothetical protein [Chlorobi bacterium CHB2]